MTIKNNKAYENLKKMSELLNPDVFKSNLILTSVFIAYFENTQDFIIDQPRNFFSYEYDSEKGFIISDDYKNKVLSLSPKNPLNASLFWFKSLNCIDNNDIEIYHELRKYRNKLAHELTKILFDEGFDKEVYDNKLNKLFNLRIKIEKWWFLNFEYDIIDNEYITQSDLENVITGGQIIFELISNILSKDEEKASYFSKAFENELNNYKT